MKKKNIKPFSVEEWKNGARVETRDGRPVRILCTDYRRDYPVVGIIEYVSGECIDTFTLDGRYDINGEDNRDLVIVEEVEVAERWADDEEAIGDGWWICGSAVATEVTSRKLNKPHNYDIYATEKYAKSALAMARISQLMAHDERYGGVVTVEEWASSEANKYCIHRLRNTVISSEYNGTYCFLAFHTPEQRQLFLEENERLVKDYLMID